MSALKTEFTGEKGDLFALALRTGLLTVVTLGIYRFWQKTRLRRWYWSSVRPGGMPFEYTGAPQEKLMGFLVAVIVLAGYLALVNIAGMFVAVRLSTSAPDIVMVAAACAPIALVPVVFVARYRARRYILSRTSWLGVRFGMDAGAWGYAWRACMYLLLTLLTLGLFWPLKTFQLEKYLTDRSWYGTARFRQHGNGLMLYGLAIPFFIGIWGTIGVVVQSLLTGNVAWLWWTLVSLPLAGLGGIYFRVASVRALAGLKELGDGMEFDLYPRTRTLLRIHILGNILSGFLVSFVSPVVLGLVVGALYFAGQVTRDTLFNPPPNLAAFIAVLTWLTVFILFSVFRQVFVVFPSVRHVAETLVVEEPVLLRGIRQRTREDGRDAGGFSEALDVGAAF